MPTPTRAAIQLPSIYLPSDFSRTFLFDMFCKKHGTPNEDGTIKQPFSRSTFCSVWRRLVRHVKIRGLRTDLCGTCDQLISQIYNGSRMGKVVYDLRQRWDAHRKHAKGERAAYTARILASKELYAKHITSDNQQFPPGVKGTRVITFDFAQSDHADQAGPSYFKVRAMT
ncbi:hypothetical protein RvY_17217 [Ramazzottius varieornatus]|uniref:Uncharacterized protein n=1 Tax=Ramazzottius varieornatus TaxID=947166 RepID=A0A1D1W5C3_RAMVA|nr:hypothetical protein RvY_17160 [Ramazzottius varieornatus]GAV07378.1 hypothetical protein RvY_17217 [Ramazzottius varieornatus]